MPTCQVCGRAPAAQVTLRRHVGMLLMQRFVRAQPTLCREHGIQAAKLFLRKTLVQGWWGIVSLFVNFYAVFTDLRALSTFKKLGEPQGTPTVQSQQTAPFPAPSATGRVPDA